jgi:hypothetical protein
MFLGKRADFEKACYSFETDMLSIDPVLIFNLFLILPFKIAEERIPLLIIPLTSTMFG